MSSRIPFVGPRLPYLEEGPKDGRPIHRNPVNEPERLGVDIDVQTKLLISHICFGSRVPPGSCWSPTTVIRNLLDVGKVDLGTLSIIWSRPLLRQRNKLFSCFSHSPLQSSIGRWRKTPVYPTNACTKRKWEDSDRGTFFRKGSECLRVLRYTRGTIRSHQTGSTGGRGYVFGRRGTSGVSSSLPLGNFAPTDSVRRHWGLHYTLRCSIWETLRFRRSQEVCTKIKEPKDSDESLGG